MFLHKNPPLVVIPYLIGCFVPFANPPLTIIPCGSVLHEINRRIRSFSHPQGDLPSFQPHRLALRLVPYSGEMTHPNSCPMATASAGYASAIC